MGLTQRRIVSEAIDHWMQARRPCALATVVSTTDSAPRGVGAQLTITDGGLWVGGISGGCAEVGVLHEARLLLQQEGSEALERAVHVTMTRDELGSVGPVCGATLGVLVERVDASLAALLRRGVELPLHGEDALIARRYEIDEESAQSLESERFSLLRTAIDPGMATTLLNGHGTLAWERSTTHVTLAELVPAAPRLVIGGAGDIACELVRAATAVGWRTAIVDPRAAFVEQTLTQVTPGEVIRQWPAEAFAGELTATRNDAFVAAAHEERIDIPFLANALQSEAFYVASVGSRVVQFERRAELEREVGVERAARHRGPAGLDIGGVDPAEIALSIMAEAVAVRHGRAAAPLRDTAGPIGTR